MNRPTEELAVSVTNRHCTAFECRKCLARAKWYRRKAWRSSKRPNRRNYGRK